MKNIISYNNIFKVSLPIIISGLSVNIVNITDTIFLSNLSEIALGAAGNAGILYYTFLMVGAGFTVGAQIIIARRNGEGNLAKIGSLVNQTGYFILLLGLIAFLILRYVADFFLPSIVSSENVLVLIEEYLHYRSWGIFFTLINLVFIAFYVGTTKTKVLSWITPVSAGINIFLDYGLIFGNLGMPALGVKGAALASNMAEAVGSLIFFTYTLNLKTKYAYKLFEIEKPDFIKIKRILITAGPIMIQNFITLGAWFIFFSLIENLGEDQLAVSHIIRSIYMFIMIPVFGFADATNTLTSNLLGQKEPNKVYQLIIRIIQISFFANLIVMPIVWWQRELAIGIYTSNPIIFELTEPVLMVISGAIFVFSIGIIYYRAIAGTGKTLVAFWIEAITIFIYLIYVYYVTKINPSSLSVVWASEFVYFGFMSVIGYLYMKYGNWKTSKV